MKRLFNRKQSPPESTTPENQATPPSSSSHPTSSTPPASFPPHPQALPPPPRIQNVGNAIGWSVSMPQFDFPYLLSLSDYLSSSSQASPDASKALRTEFKHGAPLAQERAVRLTGILMKNTDHRFRENVASKKFLGDLTDLVSSKKVEPRVKEMVYRVFSPLAYEYQRDDDLKSITQFFNKLLSTSSTSLTSFPSSLDPSSRAYQLNGAPLDPEDPLFTPTGLLPSSTTRSGRPSRRERGEGIPKELEKVQMRELGERADKARGLARLLKEAVVFNKEEEGGEDSGLEKNEMVQEFQSQCLEEQNVLGESMVWATVQAEKSRQQLNESNENDSPREEEGGGGGAEETTVEQEEMRRSRLSSNNPFAEVVNSNGGGTARRDTERKTEEETILEKILLAHSEIQDSLSLLSSRLEQSRRERQHLQDLETATELSKTYVKGGDDISREGGGNYGEGGSKQRWESVEDRERAEHEAMLREQEELDRYERSKPQRTVEEVNFVNPSTTGVNYGHNESIYSNNQNSTTTTTNASSPYDGLGALESLRGLDFSSPSPSAAPERPREPQSVIPNSTSFSSSNPYSNLSLTTNNLNSTSTTSTTSPSRQDPFAESPISSTFLPPQPSEKALGKLRRISTTGRNEGEGEDDSRERQRVLEEQLREKYRRNLEEQAIQRGKGENVNEGGIREV